MAKNENIRPSDEKMKVQLNDNMEVFDMLLISNGTEDELSLMYNPEIGRISLNKQKAKEFVRVLQFLINEMD